MNDEKSAPILSLGKSKETGEEVTLPTKALKKHVAIFGQSGSGKTVACKVVIEEAIRNNIPAIIIDPQGDISSLSMVAEWEALEKYGVNRDFYEEYKEKIEVVIFTPASEKGIPLSINPLIPPPTQLDREEKILAIDGMATNLVDVLGYKLSSNKGKAVKAYLTALFEEFMKRNILVQDFKMLMDLINTDEAYLPESYRSLLEKKEKETLVKNIKFLTVGAQSLVFNLGPKLNIQMLKTSSHEGKCRISIIYLNTLNTQKLKNLYISTISQRLYTYMLSNPSHEPQLIFYIDELAGLIPPYPRNPPTKKWLQLLFKQGRKYGVSMLVATQNISDVDYKAFGQVSTFFFGRFMAPQDLRTVEKMIQSHPTARFILDDLPNFEPGEFYLLSPDNYPKPIRFKTRWLYSVHKALSDDDVSKLYKNPPPSICKEVNGYSYDIDSLDFSDIEKELSLDDIEKEMSKLQEFSEVESLLDTEVRLQELDDFPEVPSETLDIGTDITPSDFTEQKLEYEEEYKLKKIDLSKSIKTIKKQYLKYDKIDLKELLSKFFGDKKFSYLGTNYLQLAYVPFLLLDFNINAKREIEVKVGEEVVKEEITLDFPIKRIFPLVDKLEFDSKDKIWGLESIPFQAEDVFEELLSILPLKNLGSLIAPPSANIQTIEVQRKPRAILESFQDVLWMDKSMYEDEWKRDIEDSLVKIEEKYKDKIDSWIKQLTKQRDEYFAKMIEKRDKVRKFQAQIEEAKSIYATLKPIVTNKYKYKRDADVKRYKKAVETLQYGPQVIKNYTSEIEKDVEIVKELDRKIKSQTKVEVLDDLDKLVKKKSFSIPNQNEIQDIYAAIIYIPVSIAEINIVNEKGHELLIRGIAESTLGTSISILCDSCYEKKTPKMQLVSISNDCEVCGRTLCANHTIYCSISGDVICNKHAAVCSVCKEVVSTEHVKQCSFCNNVVCDNDIIYCDVCGKVICSKHAIKVTKKGLFKTEEVFVCPDHKKKR
ncbi:MAG: DUF853 family protein [Candidatus Heimdallarchaeum aukensis]|uniref:DUF853 family protein n=1 Tax=Candidatus Heimdallarchaeum aukensis TaxID=2876573 RepID=A0A9Y1FLZ1_9ARCH|nr:MAG: DUF853 family protein [Candidatus Heimdallarchaeum aukensis]